MTKLTAVRCLDLALWHRFIASSAQGTRYAHDDIINALGCQVQYWFVMRNGKPVAAVPVITNNVVSTDLPIHSYYLGIMYPPQIWQSKLNRRTENEIAIGGFVVEFLSQHYDNICLSLHPSLQDVRGIDWFNYHEKEKGRVKISPYYTAQARLQPPSIIRSEATGARRREEKYAKNREHLTFSINGSADELVKLYQQSFARQNINLSSIELSTTYNFAQYLLDNKWGVIGVTRDINGSAVTAGLLMFDYNNWVHLPVVGIGDTRYGGTLLYFGLMSHASALGYQIIDFNGANSPNRGYFKHSVGGQAQLYFQIAWQKP